LSLEFSEWGAALALYGKVKMIIEHRKLNPKFRQWRCGGCDKLLGIIYPTRTLAIKHKDLVAYVDGKIKVICPFCKVENEFKSNQTPSLV